MKIYTVKFSLQVTDEIEVMAESENDAYSKAINLLDVSILNAEVIDREIISVKDVKPAVVEE
jgi:hypothetical protein